MKKKRMKNYESKQQHFTIIPSPGLQEVFKEVLPVSSICEGVKADSQMSTKIGLAFQFATNYDKFN